MGAVREMAELTERQRQILAAIVEYYVESAEPVGSKTLVTAYSLAFSPATVRSIMGELEGLGYLEQLHVSSGRVPTELAYRFYVDHVLARRPRMTLAESEQRQLRKPYETIVLNQIEDLFAFTTRLLSQLSHYVGVVVNTELRESTLERIELVPLGGMQILVVLVTRPGLVKHRMFSMDMSLSSSTLKAVASLLNERLTGRTLREIQEFASQMETLHAMFEGENRAVAVRIAREVFLREYENDIYWDGIRNFMTRAEFLETAEALTAALESRQRIAALFEANRSGSSLPGDVSVLIGSEIPAEGLERCSVIAAPYRLSPHVWGTVGIIGPMHMEYSRLIPLVACTADLMTRHFAALA